MKALSYLLRTQAINFLKGLLKKPWLIVIYGGLIALVVFGAMNSKAGVLPFDILNATVILFYCMQMIITLHSALTKGTTVFGVDDVNFVFTAPIKPQGVLLYGVMRQMSSSLLLILILSFQITNLRTMLGMNPAGMVLLLISIFFLFVMNNAIAMCVSALLAERPRSKAWALRVLYGFILLLIAYVGIRAMGNPSIEGLLAVFDDPFWRYIPMAGWLANATIAGNSGNFLLAIAMIVLSIAVAGGVVAYTWRKNPDYYEDVLDVTQERHDAAQLKKEGRQLESGFTGKGKTKVGKVGLGKGYGASAFFYKSLLEQRRQGLLLLDPLSLITIAAVLFTVLVTASAGKGEVPLEVSFYMAVGMLVYMQFIFNVTGGKFVQEARKHYVYMAPCSPQMKVIMCNLLPLFKSLLEAAICFAVLVFVVQLPIWQGLAATVMIGSLSMLFTAGSLLADLLLGAKHSKTLALMFFFLSQMILLLPAIAIFIALILMLPQAPLVPYVAVVIYVAGISAALFALLGGLLHNPETTA